MELWERTPVGVSVQVPSLEGVGAAWHSLNRPEGSAIDASGFSRYFPPNMSQTNEYKIHCPKCQHEQTVQLHEAINVQTSPELKVELMANRLNTVTCEQCKLAFRVDKPLLYNDPAHGRMIYLLPLSEEAIAEGEREFTSSIQRLNGVLPNDLAAPQVCLVFSRTELVERIFLFDAGLNERVIEYIKYLIYSKNEAKVTPADKVLLFDAQDSTDKALCFVIQDAKTRKLEALMQYDRQAYKGLCEMFDEDDQTATLFELFPGPYVSARFTLLRELAKDSAARQEPAASPRPAKDSRKPGSKRA
jgi:hypothetical protein